MTAVCGVIHYWWLVKADIRRPQTYAAIVAILLGFRVFRIFQESRRRLTVRTAAAAKPQRPAVASDRSVRP